MGVADYKDLRVYRLAFESAMEIFELGKSFPGEEKYSLCDEMRRFSRSVCANIAEAWRKRRYQPAFISKLSDADAEAAETQVWLDLVWLDFALRCSYLPAEPHTALRGHYDHICRQLRTIMDNADRWCSSLDGVRKELGEYFTNTTIS